MNIRRTLARATLLGATLLAVVWLGVAATPTAASTAHAAAAETPTCTQITPEFSGMTAALINPTSTVTGEVNATGCDVGVYFGPGSHGTVSHAHVYGATAFGVVVDSANVTIEYSNITDILGAPGSDEGDCGDEETCEGDEGMNIAVAGGEAREYIGSKHGTGILVVGSGAHAPISGNTVSTYGRRGISVSGSGAWASISGNTITGLGASYAAHTMGQSGVWIANGARAVVSGNTIQNNEIIGSGPASNAVMVAGGAYHNGQTYTTNIQISGNTLRNNATGVLLSNLQADGTVDRSVQTRNRVAGNYIWRASSVSVMAEEGGKPTAGIFVAGGNGDKVTGNTIVHYSPAIKISEKAAGLILVEGNTIIS